MKIVCVSDFHGTPLPEIPSCDVLVIAGDYEPGLPESMTFGWLTGTFLTWLMAAPARHIVMTPGNHDGFTEQNLDILRRLPGHLLVDEGVMLDGKMFWGSPWTPTFFNWWYMKDDPDLKWHWAKIPHGVDVLVTHGPPWGILDETKRGARVGSTTLRRRLPTLERLKLHVFGHIHESYGICAGDDGLHGTTFVNASQVNVALKPVNKPIVVTI